MTKLSTTKMSHSGIEQRLSREPFSMLDEFNEMFDTIFDSDMDFFSPLGWRAMPMTAATRRAMHVALDDEKLTLSLDVPGVKQSAIRISAKQNEVTVTARRGSESQQTYRYLIHQDYDPVSAKASLVDGVLTLEFQRRQETKPKEIPIEVVTG